MVTERQLKRVVTAGIALCVVLCINEINIDESYSRSLNAVDDVIMPEIYWGMSCPLEVKAFSVSSRDMGWMQDPEYLKSPIAETRESFTNRAVAARDLSLEAQTRVRVLDAINSRALISRKVVFMGDSLTRQQYISLGCLAAEQIDRHLTPFYPDRNGLFYDARLEWRSGGEVFYAPTAGKVFSYNWNPPPDGPIIGGEESWLHSCNNDLPFQFDTYAFTGTNSDGSAYSGTNPDGSRLTERITLVPGDVVFLNAGFHEFREEGHSNLLNLLDCMKKKGAENFPRFVYVTSSLQHFDTEHDLTNEAGERIKKCSNRVAENTMMKEEVQKLQDNLFIIGQDIDLTGLGHLHVNGEKTDCTHWFQPGVPDLFAALATDAIKIMVEQQQRESEIKRIKSLAKTNSFVADTPASLLLNSFIAERSFDWISSGDEEDYDDDYGDEDASVDDDHFGLDDRFDDKDASVEEDPDVEDDPADEDSSVM